MRILEKDFVSRELIKIQQRRRYRENGLREPKDVFLSRTCRTVSSSRDVESRDVEKKTRDTVRVIPRRFVRVPSIERYLLRKILLLLLLVLLIAR